MFMKKGVGIRVVVINTLVLILLLAWRASSFLPVRFASRTSAAIPVNTGTSTSTSPSSDASWHSAQGASSSSTSSTRLSLFEGLKSLVSTKDITAQLAEENDVLLKEYTKRVEKINALEEDIEKLSNDDLIAKTQQFRDRLASGEPLDSLLIEAFAVVREASWRILELRHYDVQLIGGMALHDNRLAEMATGEGKTLVALLPTYLNALTGQSAFVVTTNDYLARRDGENMGQVFRFLGMSVGVVQAFQKEDQRKVAYDCDVTYVANQELGFDFLRDNLAMSAENVVQQRPYSFCLVDEVDSILVDEARTPLIISRKGKMPNDKHISSAQIAKELIKDKHYEVDLKNQKVELTQAGFKFCEQIVGKSLFDLSDPWAFFIVSALKAKELFTKDKEYIIKDNELFIVDSFTGRVMEGRRFTDGIQQAIEAKEGMQVSAETEVIAKVTYQNLFRLFPKLSGMTGTAFTEADEFQEVYSLKVFPIPTALPLARRDNEDAVFRTKEGKLKALLKNVLTTHEKGRPILIGTTSVESSEEMVSALTDLGIEDVKVLNARPENVERESEIVSQAGRLGAVTVATNMAGRGTDILLGGSAKGIARVLAKQLMLVKLGLSEKPPSLPEEETSLDVDVDGEVEIVEEETDEDVLSLPSVRDLASSLELWMPGKLSKMTELNLKRAVISCLDSIGSEANRLEVEDIVAQAADNAPVDDIAVKLLRKGLSKVTSELEEMIKPEREKVKRLGGLYVIGTSRHESRRIDNQLRGRSGRQGDPGGTRFFLSMEDDIFMTFGGDKMGEVLEKFRVAEDMPIENDLVMQALDKVQEKVEAYFASNRRQVFKLDEVMSEQRAAVYRDRQKFLNAKDSEIIDVFSDYCAKTMDEIYKASSTEDKKGVDVNAEKLCSKAIQFFPNIKLSPADLTINNAQQVAQNKLQEAIEEKKALIDATGSAGAFVTFFRYLALVQTDESWCKHLNRLDLLKEEMVLQSFTAETDVLESYTDKAEKLYNSLDGDIRRNSVYSLFIYKPDASMKQWA